MSVMREDKELNSDVDFMVLVDVDEAELRSYRKKLNDIMSNIGYRHLKVLSMIDMSYEKFNYWVDAVPFYKNVRNEGIVTYEQ